MGPMGPALPCPVGRQATQGAMQQAVRDSLTAFMATTAQAQGEATKAALLS